MTKTGSKNNPFGAKSIRFRGRKPLLGCIVLFFALAQASGAWSVTVRAQLERSTTQLGDPVGLQILVMDSGGAAVVPQIPRIDGLTIQASGSAMRWINGRRTDIRNYVIIPAREGKFVIPPVSVRVGGQIFRTNQLALAVTRTPQSSEMRLVASVSKTECYVLEPVDVTFEWYLDPSVQLYGRDTTFFTVRRLHALNIPLIRSAEDLSLRAVRPPGPTRKINVNGYDFQAGHSFKTLDGTRYDVFTLAFRMFPPKPGPYVIPPATAEAKIQRGYKRTQDWIFTETVPNYQDVRAASESIRLIVKDLPADGRPDGFTGAVGNYTISVETADTQMKMGDPILLKIMISGTGLLENIKRPLISQDPAFAEAFSINESLAPGDISGNRITFEQNIRAKTTEVKEIPSVAFPYFNPDRGIYQIARSKPISITVLPTSEVTAKDVVSFEGPTARAGTTRLEEQPGGILANYTHFDALRNQAVRWYPLSFLALPPLAYLVALTVVTRRRKLAGDLALARSKSARKILKKQLAQARRHIQQDGRQFCDSLARAVTRFTSDKLNLGTGELTPYDLEMLAEENRVDGDAANKIADILRECDAARFAPSAQSADRRNRLLRQAEKVIKDFEKSL